MNIMSGASLTTSLARFVCQPPKQLDHLPMQALQCVTEATAPLFLLRLRDEENRKADHESFRCEDRIVDDRQAFHFSLIKAGKVLDPLRSDRRFETTMSKLAKIEAQGTELKLPAHLLVEG